MAGSLNISVMRMLLMGGLAALLLSACAGKGTGGFLTFQPGPAEQKLASGVKLYEEGDYKASEDALQHALSMGLKRKGDQVSAHKYLAFIHCVSKREKLCRDSFRSALEIDPDFDLKREEAGHPVWGSVFRNVKAQFAK